MSNPDQVHLPFSHQRSIDGYINRRYGTSLQQLVDKREQKLLKELLQEYVGGAGKTVLDLPCGYGRFMPLFSELEYQVTAMDISPRMVEYVRARPEFTRSDRARTADIRGVLPLAEQSVDSVSCIRLFQHLHHSEWRLQALREFARVSAGPIIVTFYDSNCLHFWTKHLLALIKRKPVRVQMISRAMFEKDVAAAGLEVLEYRAKLPGIHAQTFAVLKQARQNG